MDSREKKKRDSNTVSLQISKASPRITISELQQSDKITSHGKYLPSSSRLAQLNFAMFMRSGAQTSGSLITTNHDKLLSSGNRFTQLTFTMGEVAPVSKCARTLAEVITKLGLEIVSTSPNMRSPCWVLSWRGITTNADN